MAIVGIDALMKELSQSTHIYSGDESSVYMMVRPIENGLGGFSDFVEKCIYSELEAILDGMSDINGVIPPKFLDEVERIIDTYDNLRKLKHRLSFKIACLYMTREDAFSEFVCGRNEIGHIINEVLSYFSNALSVDLSDELVTHLTDIFFKGFDEDDVYAIFERGEYDKDHIYHDDIDIAISSNFKEEGEFLSILDPTIPHGKHAEIDYNVLNEAIKFMNLVAYLFGREPNLIEEVLDKGVDIYELLNSIKDQYIECDYEDECDEYDVVKSNVTNSLTQRLLSKRSDEVKSAFLSANGIVRDVVEGDISFKDFSCIDVYNDDYDVIYFYDISVKVSPNGDVKLDENGNPTYIIRHVEDLYEKLTVFKALFSNSDGNITIDFKSDNEIFIVQDLIDVKRLSPDVYSTDYGGRVDEDGDLCIDFGMTLKS
nr:MAG TPA: hypothetical protein [Caudoviricetes sp.]